MFACRDGRIRWSTREVCSRAAAVEIVSDGSGLKVNVRTRCGCYLAAANIVCTVLAANPSSAASIRTVQRL
jgi:hypothetical protein